MATIKLNKIIELAEWTVKERIVLAQELLAEAQLDISGCTEQGKKDIQTLGEIITLLENIK